MLFRNRLLACVALCSFALLLSAEIRPISTSPPVVFERNIGQLSGEIAYMGRGKNWTAAFEDDGFRLRQAGRTWNFRFEGAGAAARLEGVDALEAVTHYYLGPRPEDWTLNAPLFRSVAYRGIYPGVDAVFYERDGLLEYDFEISAQADPSVIRVTVGEASARITDRGELALELDGAELRQAPPRAYQTVDGAELDVEVRYALDASGAVRFDLGAYDRSRSLTIDPLVYSSYVGGSESDGVQAMAVDESGAIYLAGRTFSRDFPATVPATGNATSYLFLTKLDPAKVGADALVFSAFFGISEDNQVIFDDTGRAYVASQGFFTPPALPFPDGSIGVQPEPAGGRDVHLLVVNLSADPAEAIEYSTFLGGSQGDFLQDIRLANDGRVLLHGAGDSVDFPLTENAFGRECGPGDRLGREWLALIDPKRPGGEGLIFSTCLAGLRPGRQGRPEMLWEFDSRGRIHFAFTARDQAELTPGAFQPGALCDGCDSGFYGLIDPSAPATESLVYATHFGGGVRETVTAMSIDDQDRAWLAGATLSSEFPTTSGPLGPPLVSDDTRLDNPSAFLIGFDADATGEASRVFSTLIGGTGTGEVDALLLREGRVILVGTTPAADLPTTESAYSQSCAGLPGPCLQDIYILELDPLAADPLVYGTYIGGQANESLRIGPQSRRLIDWIGDQIVALAWVDPGFPTTAGAIERIHSGAASNQFALFTFDTRRTGAAGLTYSTLLGTTGGAEISGAPKISINAGVIQGGVVLVGGAATDPKLLNTLGAFARQCSDSSDDSSAECFTDAFAMAIDPRTGVELFASPDIVDFSYRVPDAPPDPIEINVNSDNPELRIRVQALPGRDIHNPPNFDIISVEPRELTGSGSFVISPDVRFLVPGQQYQARILLDSEDPAVRRSILVRIQAETVDPPQIGAVVSAADFGVGAIAPNQIVTVFGQNLGSLAGNQTTLGGGGHFEDPIGITAEIGGSRAPVLFARHDQVNLVVPAFAEGPSATLTIRTFAGEVSLEVPVAESSPGLFTLNGSGGGPAAALNQDTSVNTAQNPAAPESVVVLYGTGEGATDPIRQDGPAAEPLPKPILPVSVTIGGRPAEVLYAGAAPGFVGLFQINARVPADTPIGDDIPVVVSVGPNSSRTDVTLAIGTN